MTTSAGYDADTLRSYLDGAEKVLAAVTETYESTGRADTAVALVTATCAFVQAHVAVNRMDGDGAADEHVHEMLRQLAENTGILATAV